MAKAKNLVDDVLALVAHRGPGFKSWFDRLPDDARAELETVRQAFNPTLHQKKAYARAVIAVATERGWHTSGIHGVVAWLNARR
jgi:hypothetical protein